MIRVLPAGPQPQESPKIYQIECQKELQNIYEIKCECQIACQKICQKSDTWWGSLEESNLFRRLSKIDLRQPKWRLVGPCARGALRASSTTVTASSIWSWILLFHFCCALAVVTHFAPIHFYKQTTLRTEVQRSLYTEQLLRAAILTQRVCARKNFCAQTPFHRGFYAKKEVFTHRCFVQRCFCSHE